MDAIDRHYSSLGLDPADWPDCACENRDCKVCEEDGCDECDHCTPKD